MYLQSNVKKCLVTGGSGFIGSHLVELLLRTGYEVRVFDNLSSGNLDNLQACKDNIEFIKADIRDLDALISACDGIDAVFHQAAIPSVYQSMVDPHQTHSINVDGTVNILEAASRTGVKKVVFASSAAVYGADPSLPKSETHATKPVSPYGLHKLMGEQYCEMYARLYGLQTTCLRYFNVFGSRQNPQSQYSGVISIFINTILSGKNPIIFGDGQQSRDFVHVTDICQANLRAITHQTSPFEVFNVGYGVPHSLLELLDCIQTSTGREFEIQYQADRRGDLRHSLADISKIRHLLGFEPSKCFLLGLQELLTTADKTVTLIEQH